MRWFKCCSSNQLVQLCIEPWRLFLPLVSSSTEFVATLEQGIHVILIERAPSGHYEIQRNVG